jgi:hypothetical protein
MVFFPKIPIWVDFGGPGQENVGTFYGHLVYVTPIWVNFVPLRYIFWSFVIFSPFWYEIPRKSGDFSCRCVCMYVHILTNQAVDVITDVSVTH